MMSTFAEPNNTSLEKGGFKIQTRPAPTARPEDKNPRARRQRYLRIDVFLVMGKLMDVTMAR
jgi:hypothetical protein